MRKKLRSAYLLESLEARLLFSADLAPLPVDAGTTGAEFESDLEISLLPDSTGVQEADENIQERQEVIFVDSGVDDYRKLIDDIESQLEKGRQFDIVSLDSDSDGIDQISAYLKQHKDIDAVHVVSHGSEDAVKLGNVWLTPDKLDAYADAIEGWQHALSGDADLLFYGCNLAAGDGGQDLVNSLTLLTGADVAASDDLTGRAKMGGDWLLEYHKGEIETAAVINNEIQQNWNGVLASFTVDTTADTVDDNPGDGVAEDASGNTSLRAAIMEANALAGADTIFLDAATYTITLNGDTDGTGDLDIRSDLSIVGVSPTQTTINANSVHRVFDVHDEAAHTVSISNLKVENGLSPASVNGAGLLVRGFANRPDVHIDNVWFSDNDASGAGAMGGAISNSADLTVTNSLIEGNSAPEGGGVWNAPTGVLTMQNVTLSGNDATVGDGGGLFNEGNATLRHVTVTANSAVGAGGGVIHDNGAVSTDIGNSIIAGNSAASAPDITNTIGNITSSGGNIIQDATGTGSDFALSEIGINPLLGGLTDNGGNLMTHAPAAAQAIDNADPTMAPNTDQRGFLRGDGSPDIGAYEAGTSAATTAHYLDQFNAVAYNGNNGSLLWSNDWQEVGEPTDPNFGSVSVWNELGEDGLYIWAADNVGAWRQADLSGATSAVLSFDWAMLKTELGDQARLRISTDGVGWTTLDTFDGPLDHSSMQSASYDISAFIDRDTRIRFETVSGFADNDVFFVDNVSIELSTSPPVVANLAPIKDTWITINNPMDNYGADAIIRIDEKGSGFGEGHVLLQFDLSSIPAGATITSAVLQMEAVNKSNSGSSIINVYEVTEAWDEGSGGNNDATWNNRQTGVLWGTPGGSVNPPSVASLTTSAIGSHTWDITALVQEWQSGDKINNGMMLAGEDPGDVIFNYDSREGGTPPKLVITYSMPANDAPIAVADSFTVNEGSTNNLNLASNDTDADDGLDLTSITIISGPTNGTIDAINADGTVDYTHDGSETISDSFTYTIDDLATATSNTVTVSLTITPQNDAPIAVADSFTVNEGSTNNLNLASNDTDADDGLDLTSITIVSGPTNGTIDAINADGTVDYTHDGSETLTDSFTYTIDDLATATSNTVTVSLTITPQNDAPIAVADSFTVNEGSTSSLNLASNDTDADDGLDLTSITIISGPTNGTIDAINADGTVDYTHDGSETLTDSFTYTIDDLATATSNTVTVSLTITPQNDAPIAVADSFTVNEGSTNNLNLASNDTDADDGLDLTSITIISGPTNGTIDAINADGTVDYTHDGSETISDSFTYTIDDLATATSNTVTVSLTITPQNDAPIAVADSFTVNEGSTNNLNLASNDTDADDGLDLTSITIISGPTNGTIDAINADGTVDYTHDGSETISDSFTYTIDDLATATSNTVTVSLTITPQNDAPIAVADSFTVNEGSTNNLNLASNDTDADDGLDLTSITIVSGPTNGTIDAINADGTVDYTHDGSETLTDSFTYTIDDLATATSNTVTVSLTVTPQNDAPIAVADSFTVNEGSTSSLNLASNDTDADDGLDLTSITIVSGPTNGTIDAINADGTVDYTHDGSETLTDSFTYTIDDLATATSNTVTVSLTITPQNDAPIAVADSFTVNEGSTSSLNLASNDTDADDGLDLTSITIISGPTNGTIDAINADGTVDYTHDGSETISDSFTYTIDDLATATSNTVTVSLTITPQNDAPIAVADSFTVNEGSTNNLNLASNDTDADDGLDLTSITIISGPTNGTIDAINADGTVDYTHDGSETISDSFTYTIDDLATATSNTVTVSLTITPQNDAPIAVADSFTVNEGSTNNLNLASNDTDADDGLDLTSITIISGPTNGTIDAINADGTVDYTHDGSETISDSFTYTIDDLATATSNTVTVSLTITPQNDAPIAVADSFTVNEGSTNNLNLASNDTDADDGLDLTSITIISGPTNGTIDAINADGTVDYTHDGSETISDSFTYTIDDLATATSNTVTVSLTITPQNDAPIAVADSFTVNEGSTNNLNLASNDTDADDGLDLTSITIVSGPTNGTIDAINADGTVDYTHDGSETLTDSFTYTIDDLATATSNTVTVSLTVTPQNDAPIAVADSFTVNEGSTSSLNLASNDTDADDGLDLTSITIVSGPTNGTIDAINADGTVDYTHDGSETLTDSFTYTIDDLATATSNTVTVSLTITPQNDAPIAVADSFTVNEGSTSSLNLASNDTDADDGLDLTSITIISGPTNGTIDAINADGTVDYTHDGSETISDSFTYTIDDLATATSNTVTVSLTITPQNDAPIAVADSFTVNEGSTNNLNLASNDTDADDGLDLTSITIISGPTNGTIDAINPDGTVDYTHDGSETISDSFTYTIDDLATATSNTVTVSLTITPQNDAPIAAADSFTVNEGSTNNLNLASNDTDADDGLDLTSITIVSGPTNGTIDAINPDGTVDYTHDGSETISDSFTYTIDDLATATSNTVTVSLTVTPQNDAPIAVADSFTVNEGSTNNLNLASNDTDADDGLDLTSITIISGPTNGTIDAINADGTVDYTHDGSETISDSFTYTIDDLATATSNTVTVSLTITPQNDAPIAVADSFTVNEGSTNNLNLASNDTDADDGLDLTSITIVSGPTNGTIDAINADGTVDYTHDGSETISDSFTYTIDDLATATSNTVTVSLTITPQNDAPIAVADSFTVNEGSTNNLNLASNDTDADDGLDLTSITIVSGPTNGTIDAINPDGTVDYTHDGSETLTDSFTYTIDDLATATSNTVTVSLTVTPQNDAGSVTIDNMSPAQGDTLTANVIDPDGASGAIGFQWFSDGIVIGGATGKTYTTTQTDVDAVMTVTAIYTDDQGTAESLTSAPTASVTNVNDTPITVNDNLNAIEDQSMTFTSVTDLLGNDSDIDGDTLTISSFSQPANGSLADNGDGTVTYTSAGNFSGVDSFTYTISDNKGGSAAGAAIIVVTPVGDTPQVTNVSTNAEVQSGLINIDRNANDGAEVTHFKISGITNGSLYLADGVTRIDNGDFITVGQGQAGLRFTPAANSTTDGSFNVESSEDGATVASQSGFATSIISILTTAPQPAEPVPSLPPSGPEEVVSEETELEETEELEDVADETDVPAVADDMASVEAPQNAKAPGLKKASMVPGISVFRQADLNSNNDRIPGRSTFLSPQTLKKLVESENLGELKTALRKLDITTLPPDVYELVRGSLDAVQEEMGNEILIGKTVVGSAIATSVGLSAGYVVWMLKGGSLLASVLSSLPAWQLADPLAILVGTKEDEDEDDDTLETIIKDGSRRNEDKERKASELNKHKKEPTKR